MRCLAGHVANGVHVAGAVITCFYPIKTYAAGETQSLTAYYDNCKTACSVLAQLLQKCCICRQIHDFLRLQCDLLRMSTSNFHGHVVSVQDPFLLSYTI